jgi:hypothetical protein
MRACGAGFTTSNTVTGRRSLAWTNGCACGCAASCAGGRDVAAVVAAGIIIVGPTPTSRTWVCLTSPQPTVRFVSPTEDLLIGEPDAGNPPVRFGGRGSGLIAALPTPIDDKRKTRASPRTASPAGQAGRGLARPRAWRKAQLQNTVARASLDASSYILT